MSLRCFGSEMREPGTSGMLHHGINLGHTFKAFIYFSPVFFDNIMNLFNVDPQHIAFSHLSPCHGRLHGYWNFYYHASLLLN